MYPRASAFRFEVAPSALRAFMRAGSSIRLSVHSDAEKILEWATYSPSDSERPRCVEGDVAFYFSAATVAQLEGMFVFYLGMGTTPAFARSNERVVAEWQPHPERAKRAEGCSIRPT